MTPIARVFAVREGVSPRQAQEAVRAATDILEWRLGCAPPEWRIVRLAQALIEHDRTRPAEDDLFAPRRSP
jgi:hypothetical protein